MNDLPSKRPKKSYPEETPDFWRRHLSAMETGSLSKVAYCRRHGLNYDRMQYWRKRLEGSPSKKLLPVRVEDKPSQHSPLSTKSLAQIQLSSGVIVSFNTQEALVILLDKVMNHAAIV